MQSATAAHRTAAPGRHAGVVLDAPATLHLGPHHKPARVRITGIAGASYRFVAIDAIRSGGRTIAAGTPGLAPKHRFIFDATGA